jgi:hypothetical protein
MTDVARRVVGTAAVTHVTGGVVGALAGEGRGGHATDGGSSDDEGEERLFDHGPRIGLAR